VRSYIATPFWLYRVAIIDAFYWFQRCFISFYFVYALLLTTFRLLFVVFFELLAALFCRLWLVQCNFTAFSVIWLLLLRRVTTEPRFLWWRHKGFWFIFQRCVHIDTDQEVHLPPDFFLELLVGRRVQVVYRLCVNDVIWIFLPRFRWWRKRWNSIVLFVHALSNFILRWFSRASCGKTGVHVVYRLCEWRHLNIFAALSLVT